LGTSKINYLTVKLRGIKGDSGVVRVQQVVAMAFRTAFSSGFCKDLKSLTLFFPIIYTLPVSTPQLLDLPLQIIY